MTTLSSCFSQNEAFANDPYCVPCSNFTQCLIARDATVSANQLVFNSTATCKHPDVVTHLLRDYQFKRTFEREICDLSKPILKTYT